MKKPPHVYLSPEYMCLQELFFITNAYTSIHSHHNPRIYTILIAFIYSLETGKERIQGECQECYTTRKGRLTPDMNILQLYRRQSIMMNKLVQLNDKDNDQLRHMLSTSN